MLWNICLFFRFSLVSYYYSSSVFALEYPMIWTNFLSQSQNFAKSSSSPLIIISFSVFKNYIFEETFLFFVCSVNTSYNSSDFSSVWLVIGTHIWMMIWQEYARKIKIALKICKKKTVLTNKIIWLCNASELYWR